VLCQDSFGLPEVLPREPEPPLRFCQRVVHDITSRS
jgi:hypothetical protein